MPTVSEHSLNIVDGGTCQQVAISGTSAQSTVIQTDNTFIDGPVQIVITPTVDCFVRKGANPTAIVGGTDMYLLGGNAYRTSVMPGERLAFITTGAAGFVYIAPGA